MSDLLPNTFQTPNVYVDKLMMYLSDSELRVLLFATRHIYGWQDRIAERKARISLSMFEHGFVTEKGVLYAGCGLSRPAVSKTLQTLVRYRILVKVGEPTNAGQQWTIGESPDWRGLEERHAKQAEKDRKRTEAASLARRSGGTSNDTGTSDVTGSGTSDDHSTGTSNVTGSGTSDVPKQTHLQTHLQTHDQNGLRKQFKVFIPENLALKVDVLTFPAAVNAIFYAYLDVLADARINRVPAAMMDVLWEQLREDAMGIASRGFTPEQVTAFVLDAYTAPGQDYWKNIDAAMPLKHVAKSLPGYVTRKAKQGAKATTTATPAKPATTDSKLEQYTQEAYDALPESAPDWYLPDNDAREFNWQRAGRHGRARQDAERRLQGEQQ